MSEDPVAPIMNVMAENATLRARIHEAIDRVIDHGQYMLGPEVAAFETEAARFLDAPHPIAVNSGTDALLLALKAAGVGPGDEVITVANSFVATAGAIVQAGARPHFVDVGPDENMCPDSLAAEIGPRTRAIIPVHLRGRPARMIEICALAARHGVAVIEDASQAFGAKLRLDDGRWARLGTIGDYGAFSLHPQKVLGAIGDAGIVVTANPDAARDMWLMHHHGLADRDNVLRWGQNSRLDTIQAAVLRLKLAELDRWIERRREIAATYDAGLADLDLVLPREAPGEFAVYYHYSVFSEARDAFQAHLNAAGVDARMHYPVAIHRQPPARDGCRLPAAGLPRTEAQAARQLTLPIHHDFTEAQVGRVIDAVRDFHVGRRRAGAIGACHSAADAASPHLAGLDFREIPLSLIEDGTCYPGALLPPAVLSMGVFPPGTNLFGGQQDLTDALDRVDRVVEKVADAGLAGITFGAGAVRSIPAAVPRQAGLETLGRILTRLDRGCRDAKITLFIENLPPVQSNVFNTLDEIAAFCARFAMANTKILFDLRAACLAGDAPGAFDRHLPRIGHIHLTFPENVLSGEHVTDAFLRRLRQKDYAGRIAIEPVGVRWSADTAALARRARRVLGGATPLAEAGQ